MPSDSGRVYGPGEIVPVASVDLDVAVLQARIEVAEQRAAELPELRAQLRKAKGQVPEMALRPDHRFPEELDDIVVENVRMFRAEAMSDTNFWMCCYFGDNHERVTFNVTIGKNPKRIVVTAGEIPDEWIDIDAKEEGAG
jgi:hypothetical protein